MRRNTLLAQAGSRWDERTGSVTMPVYQTATFRHPALGQSTGFDYSRSGNPTRQALEDVLAALDGGARGFAFSSGLAAVDCLLHLFEPGARLLVTEDLYGGTFRLLEKIHRGRGIDSTYVDTSQLAAVEAAWDDRVRGVFVESPTNPLLKVADLSAIAALARSRGALMIVDNTFLTPVLQRPLELGADVTVYSASKYLAGHNDVVAGALVVKRSDLADRVYFHQNGVGAVLGPHDSWLVLRGLKTLALRLARQQENARAVAEFLAGHPRVTRVHFPGLASHPGRETLARQAEGFGAMVSFEVDDPGLIPQVLSRVKIFLFAESLGGVESLVTFPAVQTHADIDAPTRERLGIHDRLLRLSLGVEDVADLTEDLGQALA
ncbi:MAG: PLP-dependent transferase [Deltaproteobacteria bacterium]|nr:PLP-dependent transferase [Deltaproteobacteria bacterium]